MIEGRIKKILLNKIVRWRDVCYACTDLNVNLTSKVTRSGGNLVFVKKLWLCGKILFCNDDDSHHSTMTVVQVLHQYFFRVCAAWS